MCKTVGKTSAVKMELWSRAIWCCAPKGVGVCGQGWPEPFAYTVYEHIFGDFPAERTGIYTVYVWLWPTQALNSDSGPQCTLLICVRVLKCVRVLNVCFVEICAFFQALIVIQAFSVLC